MKAIWGTLCVAAVGTGLICQADPLPAHLKPLTEVLASAEQQGITAIVEASYDDGVWEIEGTRDGHPVELDLDPTTLKILRERPDSQQPQTPAGALSARKIVEAVEKAGYTSVSKVEWETVAWEVDAVRDGLRYELRLSPTTGQVFSADRDD